MLPDISAIYMIILFTVILRTAGLAWLSYSVGQTQITANIPYETLVLEMTASMILMFIAIQRNYYLHIFFYLAQFAILALIMIQKVRS